MDNSGKKKQQNKNNRTRGNQVCVHFYAKYSFLCVCEQQSAHLCLASGWFLGFLKKLHLFQSSQEYISILI